MERGVPESHECPGRALTSSVPLESGLSSCLACRTRAVVRLEMRKWAVRGSRAGAIPCAQKTAEVILRYSKLLGSFAFVTTRLWIHP